MERIDNLKYKKDPPSSTREKQESLFLTGPAEFLCKTVAKALLEVKVWRDIFGEFIDPYMRMDYPVRALPALRIYNKSYSKTSESWFVEGNLLCDIIFPANIRRVETEQLTDSVTAALMQQFRRVSFFNRLDELNPGLNELGKRFDVDKSLAFEWGDTLVPLTQVSLNFKIDLRQWDLYIESDNRTKDQPFERPLGDLEQIVTTIQGLREDCSVGAEIESDQEIEE